MEVLRDGFKVDMEANMDGLKENMEGLKGGLKVYMEAKMDGLKEGLEIFIQEMLPNGEKVFHETHDENKRNVNHDFREYNFGLKTNHIPMIDMKKFDDKDPVTWILQMEQYFDLNNVQNTQKLHIETLYLE